MPQISTRLKSFGSSTCWTVYEVGELFSHGKKYLQHSTIKIVEIIKYTHVGVPVVLRVSIGRGDVFIEGEENLGRALSHRGRVDSSRWDKGRLLGQVDGVSGARRSLLRTRLPRLTLAGYRAVFQSRRVFVLVRLGRNRNDGHGGRGRAGKGRVLTVPIFLTQITHTR